MNYYNLPIASSSNMGVSIASSAVELFYKWGYSIHAYWSGAAAAGQIILRGSNDFNPLQPDALPTTYTPITGTTAVVLGPGTVMWNSDMSNYRWVQMLYTPSGGGSTGVLTARANIKGV